MKWFRFLAIPAPKIESTVCECGHARCFHADAMLNRPEFIGCQQLVVEDRDGSIVNYTCRCVAFVPAPAPRDVLELERMIKL